MPENYFINQAQSLIKHCNNDNVTDKDVACVLESIYYAGIIDGESFSERDKNQMLLFIKKVFPNVFQNN